MHTIQVYDPPMRCSTELCGTEIVPALIRKAPSHREVLHYDPSRPCCESPGAADFFPDLLRLVKNAENRGRVASIFSESEGIGVQDQRLAIDEAAWNECVKHPNFRACYDLSMARLALQQAMLAH